VSRPRHGAKAGTLFERQLLEWCQANGVSHLTDLDLTHLRQWRASWVDGPLASQKKRERLRGFLNFCQSSGWIRENQAKGLSKIKVVQKPTDHFTEKEFDRIVATCASIANGTRLRALVLLMRWSGLRVGDAVTLERSRLNDDGARVSLPGQDWHSVLVTVPPDVADELRALPAPPASSARYFFWSGNGTKKSVASMWQRSLKRLFKAAKLKHKDGNRKRAHPHMLRDTFAVELLLVGVPLHDVAMLLGHKSIKTTEKHYAPFVMARMEQLDASVKAAWGHQAV
jgi:integrase/recombinase XerD